MKQGLLIWVTEILEVTSPDFLKSGLERKSALSLGFCILIMTSTLLPNKITQWTNLFLCADIKSSLASLGQSFTDFVLILFPPQPSALVRGPLPTASVGPSVPFSAASLLGALPIGARYAPAPSFSDLYPPLTSSLEDFFSSLNSFSMSESKRGKTRTAYVNSYSSFSKKDSLFN